MRFMHRVPMTVCTTLSMAPYLHQKKYIALGKGSTLWTIINTHLNTHTWTSSPLTCWGQE